MVRQHPVNFVSHKHPASGHNFQSLKGKIPHALG